MENQTITTILASAILVVLVPIVFLSRSVSRRKLSQRAREIARDLGLNYRGPVGSRRDPLFQGIELLRLEGRRLIADVMQGGYQGRSVVLADARDRPMLGSSRDSGGVGLLGVVIRLLAVTIGLGFLVASMASGLNLILFRPAFGWWSSAVMFVVYGLLGVVFALPFLAEAARRGRSASNALLIIFEEPVPGLPEFLIEPGPSPSSGPTAIEDGLNPLLVREYQGQGGSPDVLAPEFLNRAARVMVGRSTRWTVQGAGGRLVVCISDWHSPTNLRPSRSYRSVLDDAVTLRAALDGPEAAPEPSARPGPRASIRSALERIRNEPGPNHTESPG
jgi:hypothetical protein